MNSLCRAILAWAALFPCADALARGCVEAGTRIATPAGPVAVETLAPDATVLALCGEELRAARVVATQISAPGEFVELRHAGGVLRLTPEHPVAIAPGVFKPAGLLRVGDTVLDAALRPARILATGRAPAALPGHDLTVLPGATYAAAGIVVHNKGCFLPETPVLDADGGPARPISTLKPGDAVLAFDEHERPVRTRVVELLTHEVDGHLIVRTTRREIACTDEHPFYTGAGVFTAIGNLRAGDVVLGWDGQKLAPETIADIEKVPGPVRVYNLRVEAPHTFFAHGVAVHNKGGGGGCFVAGTRVALADGAARPIETLAVGATVLGFDADGRIRPVAVTAVHRRVVAGRLRLRTASHTVETTGEHPFARPDGAFTPAGDLRAGDRICIRTGDTLASEPLLEATALPGDIAVYNLTVDGPHTYFAEDLAVHNKGGGGFGGGSGGFRSYSSGGYGSSSGGTPDTVVIVIIVLVVIVCVAIKLSEHTRSDGSSAFSYSDDETPELHIVHPPEFSRERAATVVAALTRMAQADPRFDPDRLKSIASNAFLTLQSAWNAQNLEAMRPLETHALYEEHLRLIRGLINAGEINHIERVQIARIEPVHFVADREPASVTILITASAVDYYTNAVGDFLRGSHTSRAFQEFWIFSATTHGWLLSRIDQADATHHVNMALRLPAPTATGDDAPATGVANNPFADSLRHAKTAVPPPIVRKPTTIRVGAPRPDAPAAAPKPAPEKTPPPAAKQPPPADSTAALRECATRADALVRAARESREVSPELVEALTVRALAKLESQLLLNKRHGVRPELRDYRLTRVEIVASTDENAFRPASFVARLDSLARRLEHRAGSPPPPLPDPTPATEFATFHHEHGRWKLAALHDAMPQTSA